MHRALILVPIALFSTVLVAQDTKEVETFVKEAVAFAKANPKQAFINEVMRPAGQFNVQKTKRLFLTVYDVEGKVIAHGKKAQEVGASQWEAKDKDGDFYIQDRIKLAKSKGGGWVEESKINPANMKVQTKKTFIGFHAGMVICCGMYEAK